MDSIKNKKPFHVMGKPIGPLCNLNCEYCFYLKKESLYKDYTDKNMFKMTDETLEIFTQNYINSQPDFTNEVTFAWQGGEPTLMGLEFFKKAVGFQGKYKRPNMKVTNAVQTNGTLITEEMAQYFHDNNFLVGVSVDGPEELHDKYRKRKDGSGSFKDVVKGIELLKKYKVEFNILSVIQNNNSFHPKEVYEAIKGLGATYIQFIPIVEKNKNHQISGRTVTPNQFGKFMNTVFDLWLKEDIGEIFIGHFDMLLGLYLGYPATQCVHAKTCGLAMALEHNGDVYSCDHFVDPKYKVGNIKTDSLSNIINSKQQIDFGNAKAKLHKKCHSCRYLGLCFGACPKDRLDNDLNYLCDGYYDFYKHTEPIIMAMAKALKNNKPAIEYKEYL